MDKDSKNTELDGDDVGCGVCGKEYKITTGHSIIWNGIYDIKRCACKKPTVRKRHYT